MVEFSSPGGWKTYASQDQGIQPNIKEIALTDSSQYILKRMDVVLFPRLRLHQDVSKDLYEVD